MFRKQLYSKFLKITLLTAGAFLSACSSDSDSNDESDNAYAQLKIYNASSNSGPVVSYVDSTHYATVNFSNASSTYAFDNDSYLLELFRHDSEDYQAIGNALSISLTLDELKFVAITGDIQQPEIIEFDYNFTEIEDLVLDESEEGEAQFELYFANLTSSLSNLDIYLAESDSGFNNAELITNLDKNQFSEKFIRTQNEYRVFLVEPGENEPFFESQSINLDYLDTSILIVRDNFGPSPFAIDKVSARTLTTSYSDSNTDAQLQFIQAEDRYSGVDITLNAGTNNYSVLALEPNSLSEPMLIAQDTYILNTTEVSAPETPLLSNLVVDISESNSQNIVFYHDLDDNPQAQFINKGSRPLAYENSMTVVNLAKLEDSNVSFYFVPSGESISSTDNFLKEMSFADAKELTLVHQPYQILATIQDDSNNQRLLFQSDLIDLEENSNYLLILENDVDSVTGYDIKLLKE